MDYSTNNSGRKNLFFCFLIIMLVAILSCNSNKDKEAEETAVPVVDSAQAAQSIAQEDSVLIFENNADKWLDLSLKNNTQNWKKFRLKEFWYQDSLAKESYTPAEGFYTDFAPLLKWSPDSSYVLDIGTYSKVLVKDKNGVKRIEDGEVDTKAALIFPKEDSSSQLIFLGSAGNFIDGRWLNSTTFSILGTFDEKGNQKPDTLLWVIDAKDKFFRKYKLE